MSRTLGGLLLVVAVAAGVLSFAALRDLALMCGVTGSLGAGVQLAWLLPVTVDAGATAGAVAWLARDAAPVGRAFGRAMAVSLLLASVAGNALQHGLAAYEARPAWWVVVVVSAVPPAVLGACVHLAVVVGGPGGARAGRATTPDAAPCGEQPWPRRAEREDASPTPRPPTSPASPAPPSPTSPTLVVPAPRPPSSTAPTQLPPTPTAQSSSSSSSPTDDRIDELLDAGRGQRAVARELRVTRHTVRRRAERRRAAAA